MPWATIQINRSDVMDDKHYTFENEKTVDIARAVMKEAIAFIVGPLQGRALGNARPRITITIKMR